MDKFDQERAEQETEDMADEIQRLRLALLEACNIALGTNLRREAAERIRELQLLANQ
jgi:hypothetical protein